MAESAKREVALSEGYASDPHAAVTFAPTSALPPGEQSAVDVPYGIADVESDD